MQAGTNGGVNTQVSFRLARNGITAYAMASNVIEDGQTPELTFALGASSVLNPSELITVPGLYVTGIPDIWLDGDLVITIQHIDTTAPNQVVGVTLLYEQDVP
jgi:hypothetical protein